jgi:hypothetical protein
MTVDTGRRNALLGFGSVALGAAALAVGPARAEAGSVVPQGAHALPDLMERLGKAPVFMACHNAIWEVTGKLWRRA